MHTVHMLLEVAHLNTPFVALGADESFFSR